MFILWKAGILLLFPALVTYSMYRFFTEHSWPECLLDLELGNIIDKTRYEEGSFGFKYSRYMVSTEEENEKWWVEKLGKETEVLGSKVNKGFDNGDSSALNQICDSFYRLNDVEDKEEDIWRYCSVFNKKPVLVSNGGSELSFKNGKFVDLDNEDNKLFWSYQEYRLKHRSTVKFATSGPFKEKKSGIEMFKSVKDLCRSVYGISESSFRDYENDVWEFCSLTGKKT